MDTNQTGFRSVLDRNRLQQKHVADALGVSRMTVWEWASGRTIPSGSNLLRLVEYLQRFEPTVTAADLFTPETAALVVPEEQAG